MKSRKVVRQRREQWHCEDVLRCQNCSKEAECETELRRAEFFIIGGKKQQKSAIQKNHGGSFFFYAASFWSLRGSGADGQEDKSVFLLWRGQKYKKRSRVCYIELVCPQASNQIPAPSFPRRFYPGNTKPHPSSGRFGPITPQELPLWRRFTSPPAELRAVVGEAGSPFTRFVSWGFFFLFSSLGPGEICFGIFFFPPSLAGPRKVETVQKYHVPTCWA